MVTGDACLSFCALVSSILLVKPPCAKVNKQLIGDSLLLTWHACVLCLATLGALAFLAHLGQAIYKFLALRKEARSLLTLHWRARASRSPVVAVTHYRKIGAQLSDFERSKRLAVFLMRLWGYRPREAGMALIAMANHWATAPAGSPDDEYQCVEMTLYPEHRRFKDWRAFFSR